MHLLPQPQKLDIHSGFLANRTFRINNTCTDSRIAKALEKLPCSDTGVALSISTTTDNNETFDLTPEQQSYQLTIAEDQVTIIGQTAAGAFYGIQTLRQLLEQEEIPCLTITDHPGFEHRGFYHDVTRGKIPTMETLKKIIDDVAYFKMNSLQLYIEHTFPFKEFGEHIEKNGYLTPEQIKELDDYCYENFIEFIPSIATFGHLYELLEMDKYRHLQELENFVEDQLYWRQRMMHHTIDPTHEESFEIIKSMIDQFLPYFRSDKFNICCDETFDLKNGKHVGQDTGKLYIDFVKKIIAHLQSKGKRIMMWADILLQHPETIDELPKDIEYLNWNYTAAGKEEYFQVFDKLGCTQIACPGTGTWSRLVECIEASSQNILNMCDFGYKYHAKGMLNTNWGDYGNPCSMELSMHGFVLGAAKSWNALTAQDDTFANAMNFLVYKNDQAVHYLTVLDKIHQKLEWNRLAFTYSNCIYEKQYKKVYPELEDVLNTQKVCNDILSTLSNETWKLDEYRLELMIAAEGLIVMAELFAKFAGYSIEKTADVEAWLGRFKAKWLEKNIPSELFRIEDMFTVLNRTTV